MATKEAKGTTLKLEFYSRDFEVIYDLKISTDEFDKIYVNKEINYEKLDLSKQPFGTYWLQIEDEVQNFFCLLIVRGFMSLSCRVLATQVKYLRIFEL